MTERKTISHSQTQQPAPIAVVGAGLVGLMAARRLADLAQARGETVALIAPKAPSGDKRTTAMLMPTIRVLEDMALWEDVQPQCAPLKTMRLVDGSNRLIRAPLVDFRASELDLEAFGYNVPNDKMVTLLEDSLQNHPALVRVDATLESVQCHDDHVELRLSDGSALDCKLLVAADGRHSTAREAALITCRTWSYPQSAIVLTFQHTQSHHDVSSEFHTETGPFTQVPLPPQPGAAHRSSLVWVVRPQDVDAIMAMDPDALALQIETKMQSHLGRITVEGKPQVYQLSGMTARSFAQNRVALIGEAGHVFPPIGAQGFNLGVRDVEALVGCLKKASGDPGSPSILAAYSRRRIADVALRTGGVDVMNRSLLSDFLPVQAARALTIGALGNISWLRRIAMKQGLGASSMVGVR
ncbi:MAG: UbiH/UbiF family hydroxylase [Pseudomonadota bacterium]